MRRAASIVALFTAVAVALACAGVEEGPKMAPGTPPDPTPAAPAAPASSGPSAPSPAAAPVNDVCTDDCLLLLDHDVRDLKKGTFCDTCPSDGCDGWPPEKLACDQVDFLRNCMYARLGYTFSKADEWREVFDKEAWYEPRKDFEWSDVSQLQVRNANWLRDRRKRRDCVR